MSFLVLRKKQKNKSNLRFAPILYLNVAHPFCEGDGWSMHIWLDAILKRARYGNLKNKSYYSYIKDKENAKS